jgi:hypothetical protein
LAPVRNQEVRAHLAIQFLTFSQDWRKEALSLNRSNGSSWRLAVTRGWREIDKGQIVSRMLDLIDLLLMVVI